MRNSEDNLVVSTESSICSTEVVVSAKQHRETVDHFINHLYLVILAILSALASFCILCSFSSLCRNLDCDRLLQIVLTYEVLADSCTLSVAILTYVNLSVEVQLSKNHLHEALVATAIYVCTFSSEIIALDQLLTLILNIIEQVSTADLVRKKVTYNVILSSERYVTEQVDSVVVRQSTKCASLGDESTLILELYTRRVLVHLTDKLVTKAHLVENTVVHSNDKLV